MADANEKKIDSTKKSTDHTDRVDKKLAQDNPEVTANAVRSAQHLKKHTVSPDGKSSFAITEKGKSVAQIGAEKQSAKSNEEHKHAVKTDATIKQLPDSKSARRDTSEDSTSKKVPNAQEDVFGINAKEIHHALQQRNFVGLPEPDVNKIENILLGLKETDRKAVEVAYNTLYHTELRDDFRKSFAEGSPNRERVNTAINRKDGVTDVVGHLQVALSQLHEGKDRKQAETDIRHTVAEMPKSVMDAFRKDPLAHKLVNHQDLSEETRCALGIMLVPDWQHKPELVKELASIGSTSKRLEIFQDAMQYSDQKCRDAFAKSRDGQALLSSSDENIRKLARDFVQTGAQGLESQLLSNLSWLGKNKENIALSIEHASRDERKNYFDGERLSNKKSPTPEEVQKISFYKDLDSALHKASDTQREYELLRAKLHGDQNFLVKVLETHNDSWIGGGHDIRNLHRQIESMSEHDWNRLRTDRQYKDRVENALGTFLQGEEKQEILKALNQKIGDPKDHSDTFEKASTRGDRTLAQVATENKKNIFDHAAAVGTAGFHEKDRDYLERLGRMSSSERSKLVSDDGYRKSLLENCQSDLSKAIVGRMIQRVEIGKSPALDKLERATLSILDRASPIERVRTLEAALRSKENRTTLDNANNHPLRNALESVLKAAVNDAGFGDKTYAAQMPGAEVHEASQYLRFKEELFSTGRMPLLLKNELCSGHLPLDDILGASAKEKFALLEEQPKGSDKELQKQLFRNEESKQLIRDALQSQALRAFDLPLDQMVRAFKLDKGVTETDLLSRLKGLSEKDLVALNQKYAQHYHSSCQADVLAKVSREHRDEFGDVLFSKTVWQKVLDERAQSAEINEFFASPLTMSQSENRISKLLAEHKEQIAHLSEKDHRLLDDALEKFRAAEKEYIKTKGKNAEQFVDATTTAAAIVATLVNPAASLQFIAPAGAAGAAYRYAALKAILGKDFENSPDNVKRVLFEGFATTSLCMFGPESAGIKGMFKVGEKTAGKIAEQTLAAAKSQMAEGLIKPGAESVIRQGLASASEKSAFLQDAAYLQSVQTIAKQIARPGAGETEIATIERLLKQKSNEAVKDGINARFKHEIKDLFRSATTGAIANTGREFGATAVGLQPTDTLAQRSMESALAGTIGAALGHTAFRPVEALAKGLAAKIHADQVLTSSKFKPVSFETSNSTVHWNALEQNRVQLKEDFFKGKTIQIEEAGQKRSFNHKEQLPIESKLWVNGEMAALNLDGKILKVSAEKKQLIDAVNHRFNDSSHPGQVTEQGKEFRKLMEELDRAVPDLREQARVHHELRKLLKDIPAADKHPDVLKTKEILTEQADRTQVAEQLARQIINAHKIAQGGMTCNVTTIEHCLAKTAPGDYARVIASAATEGELRLSNGTTIYGKGIDACLKDYDSLLSSQGESRYRSLSSRIFQQYAAESHLVFRSKLILGGRVLEASPGGFKYCFYEKAIDNCLTRDGEVILEGGKPITSPMIGTEDLQDINSRLSGRRMTLPTVALKRGPGAEQLPGQALVSSKTDFQNLLIESEKNHSPIIIGVDLRKPELFRMIPRMRQEVLKDQEGQLGHVIVVSPYFDATSKSMRVKLYDPEHLINTRQDASIEEAYTWLLEETGNAN
ncbi:MAG: hypothetical protein K2X77_06795 [Candidatus Obscuribacterales bacterium]|nr:hypothetical protein [Candidatus Obscuribacterales bacterium]